MVISINFSYPHKMDIRNIASSRLKLSLNPYQVLSKLRLASLLLLTSALSFNTFAGNIVAEGNFETKDTSQWHLWQGRDKNRQLQIVTSPVRQGRYAAKFEVRNGDQHGTNSGERSEVSNLLPTDIPFENRDGPGDDYYYAWSSYFPTNFPSVINWAVITQWHEATGGSGSVNLAVRVSSDQRLILTHNPTTESSSNSYEILPTIEKGVWHDFIVRVKWSCGRDGILELWHKRENEKEYVKKVNRHNIQTAKFTTYCNPVYKKQGLYRSAGNTATHTIYHDGFVQAKTFELVAASAHNVGSTRVAILPPSQLKVITNQDN